MKNIFQDLKRKDHKRYLGGLDVFKYIGPGLLVTVGFIDPGNWASNFAAGSRIWLFLTLGGYIVHYYADCASAQRCPPGDCYWALPFGGGH